MGGEPGQGVGEMGLGTGPGVLGLGQRGTLTGWGGGRSPRRESPDPAGRLRPGAGRAGAEEAGRLDGACGWLSAGSRGGGI